MRTSLEGSAARKSDRYSKGVVRNNSKACDIQLQYDRLIDIVCTHCCLQAVGHNKGIMEKVKDAVGLGHNDGHPRT